MVFLQKLLLTFLMGLHETQALKIMCVFLMTSSVPCGMYAGFEDAVGLRGDDVCRQPSAKRSRLDSWNTEDNQENIGLDPYGPVLGSKQDQKKKSMPALRQMSHNENAGTKKGGVVSGTKPDQEENHQVSGAPKVLGNTAPVPSLASDSRMLPDLNPGLTEHVVAWVKQLDEKSQYHSHAFSDFYRLLRTFTAPVQDWAQLIAQHQRFLPARFWPNRFVVWPRQNIRQAFAAQMLFQAALDKPHQHVFFHALLPLRDYSEGRMPLATALKQAQDNLQPVLSFHAYMRKRFSIDALVCAARLQNPWAGVFVRALLQYLKPEDSASTILQEVDQALIASFSCASAQHINQWFDWTAAQSWGDLTGDDLKNFDLLGAKAAQGLPAYLLRQVNYIIANRPDKGLFRPQFCVLDNPLFFQCEALKEKAAKAYDFEGAWRYGLGRCALASNERGRGRSTQAERSAWARAGEEWKKKALIMGKLDVKYVLERFFPKGTVLLLTSWEVFYKTEQRLRRARLV